MTNASVVNNRIGFVVKIGNYYLKDFPEEPIGIRSYHLTTSLYEAVIMYKEHADGTAEKWNGKAIRIKEYFERKIEFY